MAFDNGGSGRLSRRSFLAGAVGGAVGMVGLAGSVGRAQAGEAPASFSLRNARLVLPDGTLKQGGVRVEAGVITEVGASVTEGTDLGGAWLYPGMYPAGTQIGLREVDQEPATIEDQEGSAAVTPQARVDDAWNPRSVVIPVLRMAGIVGALVTPGHGALVSGQAGWFKLAGERTADARLLSPAALCVNLGRAATGDIPGSPKARMGVAYQLRDLLDANAPPAPPPQAARHHRRGEAPPPPPAPPTRAQQAWYAARTRALKVLFYADSAEDIRLALELIDAYQLDGVIQGAAEGHLVAKEIAAAGVPVLVSPLVHPSGKGVFAARFDNPARMHAAGVKLGFQVGGAHMLRDLPTQVAVAVSYGLPFEAAMTALCGSAASWWGLKVGQLAPGYAATFVQTGGDPLQPRTRVLGVWMNGAPMPLQSRQTELYDRYKTLD